MEKQRLLELQTQRGTRIIGSEANIKTFDTVVNECRRLIQDKAELYRNLGPETRHEKIKSIIIGYVMGLEKHALVDGFYTEEDKKLETNLLIDRLTQSILDYDILTDAMRDPDVYEIRANGKEIKVEIAGRCQDLKDRDGRVISFSSPEQQLTIIRKLMGDVRLSAKDAVVNARTVEGYRMAVVHSSALGDDPGAPDAPKYHAFVLRKFAKKKMDLSDVVKKHTMSDNMARFLSLMMAGGLTFFTCGPTASGKSTTNNAILQYVPYDTRVVLLQNPSEIDLRMKDETGRVYNDCIHLEYRDINNPGPNDPTSKHMMEQILRFSPTFVCFGEWRSNEEFKLGIQIAQAGHPINSTLHAHTAEGAVTRIQTAYLAMSGNEPASLALKDITDVVDIIIIQKIMRDGTRKVLDISEVGGVRKDDSDRPEIRPLFKFVTDGDPVYGPDGRVEEIPGHHVRVGALSKELADKMRLEGIASSRFDFMIDPPKTDSSGNFTEVETYTGENIRGYGMKVKSTV